ncbi:hypothetical protein BASA83_001054 [Batrachochytrium salamandrivorans]|nr:hypothetical protein BASA83_001054 [Batrachochytrium salamandrivorans]
MRLGCAKPAAAKPLCKATAATTIGSYQSIFSNTKFCTPGVPHTLDAQTTAFAASLPETPASGCILALRSETAMCGFSTTPELTAFCSAASSSTEGCCIAARAAGTLSANGTAANGTTTSSDPANSPGSGTLGSAGGGPGSEGITSSSPNSTNISSSAVGDGSGASSKPNLYMVIIGIVCGVVVLALVAIVIFLVRRRKSNNKVLEANIPETVQVAETMQVIYDYAANLFDELELHIGDNVIVKCKFDDGWAFGFNMSTKQEGSFPMACVASIQTQRDSLPPLPADGMTDRIRQRASSLYAPNPNIQY